MTAAAAIRGRKLWMLGVPKAPLQDLAFKESHLAAAPGMDVHFELPPGAVALLMRIPGSKYFDPVLGV